MTRFTCRVKFLLKLNNQTIVFFVCNVTYINYSLIFKQNSLYKQIVMKILFMLAAVCISLSGFSQKRDYLIKNNGDTIWGDITLKNKVFYVKGTSATGIQAEDIAKIKSRNFKGNTVVHCNLQTYTDDLTDLEIDFMQKGSTDTVLILDE